MNNFSWTANVAAGLLQPFATATTLIVPLAEPTVTVIEEVVDDPDQPEGNVQI